MFPFCRLVPLFYVYALSRQHPAVRVKESLLR
jgi:hypothetical protein